MNVSEMTPEQVRREIAERLGYRVEFIENKHYPSVTTAKWWFHHPTGSSTQVSAKTEDGAWLAGLRVKGWCEVPDWPHDTGAALDLCLECLRRKHRDNHVPPYIWTLEFCAGGVVIKRTSSAGDIVEHSARGWDALALARLALLALRAQEGRGVSA